MPRELRIVVVDETGTANRPQDKGEHNFGVGALILPARIQAELANASAEMGKLLKKKDYKYRHVQARTDAREHFIDTLNGLERQIQAYAFFSANQAIADEARREQAAAEFYGSRTSDDDEGDTTLASGELLESFIAYMAPQIGAHALTNGYNVEVHWDRRTDLAMIEEKWMEHLAIVGRQDRYRRIQNHVTFAATATGELGQITRLVGVLAGDIREYFLRHGERIWKHLDEEGLREGIDPILHSLYKWKPPPVVKIMEETLADISPATGSRETVMLQGYYKRLLKSDETGRHLVSFGAPGGRLGILAIEHGARWFIHQVPD